MTNKPRDKNDLILEKIYIYIKKNASGVFYGLRIHSLDVVTFGVLERHYIEQMLLRYEQD